MLLFCDKYFSIYQTGKFCLKTQVIVMSCILFFPPSPIRPLQDLGIWLTWRVLYKKQELLSLCGLLGSPLIFLVDFLFFIFLLVWCFSCLFWLSSVRVLLPMLPVSLDCPFLIAPSIYSNNYLFICFIGVAMSVLIVISWTFPLVRSSIILLLPLFIGTLLYFMLHCCFVYVDFYIVLSNRI